MEVKGGEVKGAVLSLVLSNTHTHMHTRTHTHTHTHTRNVRPPPHALPHLRQHVGCEASRLDGQVVQLALLVRLAQDVLLNGVGGHQAVDVHLGCVWGGEGGVAQRWSCFWVLE